jgi:hypothetical protein
VTVTLVVPAELEAELAAAIRDELETAGVLLARLVRTPRGNTRLLARAMHWVPDDAYIAREADSMRIASHGYVPALAAAEADQAIPIWLHTHPGEGSSPDHSRYDEIVDEELAEVFRLRADAPLYGSIVVSSEDGNMRFRGHLRSDGERMGVDRLWVVGRRFALISGSEERQAIPDLFDRNVRAFGGDIQRVLGSLSIAIVGCGGTGSAVAEQLGRLGVRSFDLFDPDALTESNLTRVYGSFVDDIGQRKVEVLARHLRRINPGMDVGTHAGMITTEELARRLVDADVVFGCTDDNAGRLVLSRFASYFMTPVIDCGVVLSSGCGGRLEGIDGRVTVLAPGAACLVCRGRIDLGRAAAEMLTPDEHHRLADEGYAPALGDVDPAVVTYTTHVAAAAVGELLEHLIHYGPDPAPSELLLRLHERELSTNDTGPLVHHYCHPGAGKLGLGFARPFLEQTWQT